MALSSTPYRVRMSLSDTDRGLYGEHSFTIARHPSETELRMTARLLAWGLWWDERLAFGRGLSDVDEPALWRHSLDGQVEHWIDVGRPDADRMTRSARHQPRASVLAYGPVEIWRDTVVPKVMNLPGLDIAVLPPDVDALADDLPRKIDWSLMIADDVLYVGDAEGQHQLPLEWIKRVGGR